MMFRYKRRLPELPNVPLQVNSSALDSCGRRVNLTALHYLDSTRFIASLSNDYGRSLTSDRTPTRRPLTQRRRKTHKSGGVRSRSAAADAGAVDTDCLRLIFVAVDVAIVAFHLCRGYVDLERLQRCRCQQAGSHRDLGTREHWGPTMCIVNCRQRAGSDPRTLRNGGMPTSGDRGGAGLGRLIFPPPPSAADSVTTAGTCSDSTARTPTENNYVALREPRLDARSTDAFRRRRRRSQAVARRTLQLVGRVVRSRALLPLLACAFVVAATHCVIRTCSRLGAVSESSALASVFASSVRFQTAAANAHLDEDARYLDSAVLRLSASSMTQDLHSLLSIVQYFRQGLHASPLSHRTRM